jgi:N-acetyltransferase
MLQIQPITLEGQHVKLAPLTLGHVDSLCEVGLDPSIWEWNSSPVYDQKDMLAYVESALNGQERGDMLPFVTIEKNSGQVIGSTRYAAIDMVHKRLEIGWTWITPAWQRTFVNTEAKLLMLRYAFNTLGCNRVEWKTDALNTQSRNAILRLGAVFEGTFRQHMTTSTERLRDTVYYSVVKEEWAAVEHRLVQKLG